MKIHPICKKKFNQNLMAQNTAVTDYNVKFQTLRHGEH